MQNLRRILGTCLALCLLTVLLSGCFVTPFGRTRPFRNIFRGIRGVFEDIGDTLDDRLGGLFETREPTEAFSTEIAPTIDNTSLTPTFRAPETRLTLPEYGKATAPGATEAPTEDTTEPTEQTHGDWRDALPVPMRPDIEGDLSRLDFTDREGQLLSRLEGKEAIDGYFGRIGELFQETRAETEEGDLPGGLGSLFGSLFGEAKGEPDYSYTLYAWQDEPGSEEVEVVVIRLYPEQLTLGIVSDQLPLELSWPVSQAVMDELVKGPAGTGRS